MTLYTEVSLNDIFEGHDQLTQALEEIQVEGVTMQVEPMSTGQAKIVRLISSDPNDYLNPRLQPGSIIEYKPYLMP
ncbi:YlzJ-like family protein [Marinicrinis lubricantis]|uniref:YlzJ-like family protein n=1 Tax=Marinicrinis lubricantis TaxID=2086470 RepID=A0ABW1IM93_9BACL